MLYNKKFQIQKFFFRHFVFSHACAHVWGRPFWKYQKAHPWDNIYSHAKFGPCGLKIDGVRELQSIMGHGTPPPPPEG